MKSINNVKFRAREIRSLILAKTNDLFEGIKEYVETKHEFTVVPIAAAAISDAKAVLNGDQRILYYDQELDNDPVQRLLVIAHELGHLVLHKRLTDQVGHVDLLSPYLNTGGPALARYNRRSREEIEADAFANEFVLPSRDVFDDWINNEKATSTTLAEKYNLSTPLINSRLAEALFEEILVKPPAAALSKRVSEGNPWQIEASQHTGSPVLVKAGPGTGKTATLILRIEYLIEVKKAHPSNLLVLTFSNEAAEELRERVEARFGVEVAEQIEITTFHGFGHAALISWESGLPKDFVILDESRQEEMVYEILGKLECDAILNLRDPQETSKRCVQQVTKLKELGINPEVLQAGIGEWQKEDPTKTEEQEKARVLLNVYRAYEQAKFEANTVDFADLINLPLQMMEANPPLVAAVRNRNKWVMVDEYQDVSRSVAKLLQQICGPDNPPWVVGDLRQAIYLFCGAAPENLIRFSEEFPNAREFELGINYRSCIEIIEGANQLADSMENPNEPSPEYTQLWTKGSPVESLEGEEVAIRVAEADSDAAEYDGIANQVSAWAERVPLEDIAVLARRNKDVRDIALELGKRGFKIATPGLITPDGPAGLLACVSTYVDGRTASLPRVVYALGAGRFNVESLNRAVETLSDPEFSVDALPQEDEAIREIVNEVIRLDNSLLEMAHARDGFDMICTFLFEGSDYLRKILKNENESQRTLDVSEIISGLSWAIAYRYSHPDTEPPVSRLGFGQYFRGILTSAKPSIAPPRKIEGAVQLMTCHASKGLEFPCVAVAGQTLSGMKETIWYPPQFEVQTGFDQPDALLFVGASRAKRSLLISYAKTPMRKVTPLLLNWVKRQGIPVDSWTTAGATKLEVDLKPIWGFRAPKKRISTTNLEKSSCGIKVYVQDIFGGRFPRAFDGLYPPFFAAVRRAIGKVVSKYAEGVAVSSADAEAIFIAEFVRDKIVDLPFFETYKRRGIKYVAGFAREFAKAPRPMNFIDTDTQFGGEIGGELIPLRYDFSTHYVDEDQISHAVLFRPQSLGDEKYGVLPDELAWSKLAPRNQISLVLMRLTDPELRRWVYSGSDEKLYQLKWHKTPANMDTAAVAATERRRKFSGIEYDATIKEFNCEACDNRPNCPYWMNAIPE